ncbi:MAG: prolyl oligopeptidase family serine peptidase [Nibricoccus sp.]
MSFKQLFAVLTSACVTLLSCKVSAQTALPTPAVVSTDEAPKRFFNFFVPFRTNQVALSPDGKYLAYTLREKDILSVVVVDVDNPSKATAKVAVISNEQATPMSGIKDKESRSAQIRWMGWTTATRLVVETNRVFPTTLDGSSPTGTDSNVVESSNPLFINIVGEILAFDYNGQNARSLLTPRDIREGIPFSSGKQRLLARSPHIVDFAGDDPDCVIVQADGIVRPNSLRHVERFKLNVKTGKLKELDDYTISSFQNYLFDRDGKPRIAIPISVRDPFPHVITYDSGSTFGKWKPLDQLATPSGRAAFSLSPKNYFGERSVPLGFDYDSNLLYFASNVGRDTFGIYGLDMKSGKLSHMSAENPAFDMYTPGPGVFPDSLVFSLFGREGPKMAEETSETNTQNNAIDAWNQDMASVAGAENDTAIGGNVSNEALNSRAEVQGRAPSIIGRIDGYPLVYDRFQRKAVGLRMEGWARTTRWFTPDLQAVQDELESVKRGCSIQILSWDSARQRFLVDINGVTDAGAFYIYEPAKKKLLEFVSRAPAHGNRDPHDTTLFSFTAPQGHNISGMLTFPRTARTMPVPIIVVCGEQPWARVHTDYSAEVLSYADMGFAVVQVNPRGTWGFGLKHRNTFKDGYEDAQIADISAAIDHLSRSFAVNRKRVAISGVGFGGYVALRGVQLEPTRYRCAIAIETILDLQGWVKEARWTNGDSRPQLIQEFLGGAERLKKSPLLTNAETISNPILMMNYRGPGGTLEPAEYIDARALVRKVKSKDVNAEIYDLSDDFMAGLPEARSEAHRKIEDFLNENIYNYKVKAGELKILKE